MNLRLVPRWPTPVRAAYLHWGEHINDITDLLARQDGTEPTQPNGNDRTALLIRACVLGLNLADPSIWPERSHTPTSGWLSPG
ncbi:MAG: hypothetical protein ACRDOO_27005 [Actinomadura sp.]